MAHTIPTTRDEYIPPHRAIAEAKNPNKQSLVDRFDSALLEQPNITLPISFFTGDAVVSILTSVYFGLSISNALRLANVPHQIFLQWKSMAVTSNGLMRRFFMVLDRATVEFELIHIKNISLQSTIDAKASLLLLERTRDSYAPKSFIQVSTLEGGYIEDLKSLVSSGSITVDDLVAEIPDLDEMQVVMLYGVERQRMLALESANTHTQEYLVK